MSGWKIPWNFLLWSGYLLSGNFLFFICMQLCNKAASAVQPGLTVRKGTPTDWHLLRSNSFYSKLAKSFWSDNSLFCVCWSVLSNFLSPKTSIACVAHCRIIGKFLWRLMKVYYYTRHFWKMFLWYIFLYNQIFLQKCKKRTPSLLNGSNFCPVFDIEIKGFRQIGGVANPIKL